MERGVVELAQLVEVLVQLPQLVHRKLLDCRVSLGRSPSCANALQTVALEQGGALTPVAVACLTSETSPLRVKARSNRPAR